MLEHVYTRAPVKALKYTSNYLLAPDGPRLKIFARHGRHLIHTLQIFSSQDIHGIAVKESQNDAILVLWGGPYISILTLGVLVPVQVRRITPEPIRCVDWILDANLHLSDATTDFYRLCLVTAHNTLLVSAFAARTDDAAPPSIVQLTPNSTCLLYSARIVFDDRDQLLVLVGTIFGDIEFWSIDLSLSDACRRVHYVLSGHDGSVFGVDISAPVRLSKHGQLFRLLASCSDDRKTHIWAIPATAVDWPESASGDSRETGFGVVSQSSMSGQGAGRIAQAWGHSSRIWSARFVQASGHELPMVITCGEDATAIVWQLKQKIRGPLSAEYELDALYRTAHHRGKHIWSSDVACIDRGELNMATGGADGAIAFLKTKLPLAPDHDRIVSWRFFKDPSNQTSHETARVRSYSFWSLSDIAVVVDTGDIYTLNTTCLASRPLWVAHVESLRGFSISAGVPESGMLLTVDRFGSLYSLSRSSKTPKQAIRGIGKPAALFVRSQGSGFTSLTTFVDNTTAQLFEQSSDAPGAATYISLPPAFITTSFALADSHRDHTCVFLGGRDGRILVFGAALEESSPATCDLDYKTAMKDTVTDMVSWKGSDDGFRYLIASGRDGSVAIFRVLGTDNVEGFELCHHLPVRQMTVVEQLACDPARQILVACGFSSSHFIMQDLVSGTELLRVDCGGANRTWAFQCSADVESGSLVWTRSSQLCSLVPSGIRHGLIQPGSHGREIKAVAISPSGTGPGHLVATGAEDTDIAISRLKCDSEGRAILQGISWLHKHNTGIQQLKWSEDGGFLFSSGGVEELFAWRVQSAPLLDVGVYLDSACPTESDEADARVMDLCVRSAPSESAGKAEFVIGTVRSDSTILVYSFASDGRDKSWNKLYSTTYRTCCMTTCLYLPAGLGDGMLVTATDGHALCIDSTGSKIIEPGGAMYRIRIHQNAIQCAALHRIGSQDWLYFTGGDDNALGITRLRRIEGNARPEISTLVIPRAHASSISGVCVLRRASASANDGRGARLAVATVGLDHRVKVWEVSTDPARPGVESVTGVRKVQDEYTTVADASSMDVADVGGRETVVICGVGIGFYHVEQEPEMHELG